MSDDTPRHHYLKTMLYALAVVAMVALLGAFRDLRQDFNESRDDTRCILHELADHRQKNRLADGIQLEAVGVDPDVLPAPPTLPDTDEWNKACAGILDHED